MASDDPNPPADSPGDADKITVRVPPGLADSAAARAIRKLGSTLGRSDLLGNRSDGIQRLFENAAIQPQALAPTRPIAIPDFDFEAMPPARTARATEKAAEHAAATAAAMTDMLEVMAENVRLSGEMRKLVADATTQASASAKQTKITAWLSVGVGFVSLGVSVAALVVAITH